MVDSMSKDVVTHLERGLIVSCQAPEGSPLGEPKILAQIALAAEDAGAIAIRAQGLANIEAIKGAVSVPVIGLIKRWTDSPVYITPAITDVQDLAAVGADIIALDATDRLREGGQNAFEFVVEAVHAAGDIPIMADIDDLASALTAESWRLNGGDDLERIHRRTGTRRSRCCPCRAAKRRPQNPHNCGGKILDCR